MSYNSFAPNTKVKSSEVNANFANAVHISDVQKIENKIPVLSVISDDSGDFDLDAGNYFVRTLSGSNGTLSLANVDAGQLFFIDLVQDSTGSRTVTWFSGIKWVNGNAPTLTTTANKIDSFAFRCVSAGVYQGYVVGQNLS